jgi:pimeloyl-ACP methyl ester carboxylesterase
MKQQQRLTAAALVVCGLTLVAPPADAQVRDLQDRTLTADDGTAFVVTSGVVRVPEERAGSGAGARTIDLAVVRIRRGPAPSRTAHVVLAGGPGDSGVNLVLGMARQGGAGLADLIAGDYIGIDQRGTGQSTPNLASTALYGLPLEEAGSPATWLPVMERASKTVAAEFTARGIRLQGYNTRESADDVEDVRRALGYDRITLWGRSYGSHLALAVLRRHPAAIDRLVLIGPEGPNHTWKLPSQVDEVLQRLEDKTGLPQLRGQMREVIAQLARTPAVVDTTHPMTRQPISVTIGAFDLQWITAQALADPRAITTLPVAYREMAAGDFRRIAPLVVLRRARLGVESAMKHMMDVSSGATAERLARIEREAATSILGNAINFPGLFLRHAWGTPDLGDDFRAPVTSSAPVLILVGDLDPRTPIENGREIARTLTNGRLVVVENASHQFDVFGSAPIRTVLGQFLSGAAITAAPITLPPLPFQK